MYYVRLNEDLLPTSDYDKQMAIKLAATLAYFCTVREIYEDPILGRRFAVEEIPQDIPQAGICWQLVKPPTNPYKTIFPKK